MRAIVDIDVWTASIAPARWTGNMCRFSYASALHLQRSFPFVYLSMSVDIYAHLSLLMTLPASSLLLLSTFVVEPVLDLLQLQLASSLFLEPIVHRCFQIHCHIVFLYFLGINQAKRYLGTILFSAVLSLLLLLSFILPRPGHWASYSPRASCPSPEDSG